MTVIVLEKVTPGLRGMLTRWMLEVHPGVFVGSISARVRSVLWDKLIGQRSRRKSAGSALLIHNTSNEQGFTFLVDGAGTRKTVDFDGLILLARPVTEATKKRRRLKAGHPDEPAST